MKWTAYIYDGFLPLVPYSSESYKWEQVPDRIAFVDIQIGEISRRLQGYDQYYIDVDSGGDVIGYGMLIDEENLDAYEGRKFFAVQVHEGREEVREQVPTGVTIRAGVMLTDEHAREVGLL